jgi:hypothetical protein
MTGRARLPRIAVVAALAAFAVLTAGHVKGYVVYGQKWATANVPFYVNPANNDITPDAAIAALDKAATAWSSQTGASIRLFLAGTTSGSTIQKNGKNEVFFRNESSGTAAGTTIYYYSGSQIVDADIKLYDGGVRFFTGASGCSGGFYLEDIATHEFGHFIGVGHSPLSSATMYPSINGCTTWARTLDVDDIAAARLLYPSALLQLPAAPYSLSAIAASSSSVSLTWVDASSNEGGFRVERASGGGAYALVASLPANTRSWVNTGLAAATAYSFRVRAYNTAGSSAYSNTATATTSGTTSLPAAPSSLRATAASSSSVSLAWVDASSNESGFRVERASGGSAYALVATLAANTRSWVNSGLSPATAYSYRLRAYNTAGSSGYSNSATATTPGTTSAPAVPSGPSPAHGALNVSTSVVAWAPAARATSYQVYFGRSSAPPLYQSPTSTSVSVGKLAAGVTYYWRVVARNSAGSTSGPVWRFTTRPNGKSGLR